MKVLFVFGTRPEAIKLSPLIRKMKEDNCFEVEVCVTGQHREMLDQVLDFFGILPDYDLAVMKTNQDLSGLTSRILLGVSDILSFSKPDLVVVQGDTTTTFAGALASFYQKIPIAHIEAGLRSGNKYSPFPEEINRVLVSELADFHFVPTKRALENLKKEGIINNIWVVGNTVIDALFMALEILNIEGEEKFLNKYRFIDFTKKIILVTTHRRENFGKALQNICLAIRDLASLFKEEVEVIFPVHLNPNVQNTVRDMLSGFENIHLLKPLPYPELVWFLYKAFIVLTDSGGLQEEAPALGKPVLVMRENTERIEGIEAGTAILVGTDREKIVKKAEELILDRDKYIRISRVANPYGDGKASERIMAVLRELFVFK